MEELLNAEKEGPSKDTGITRRLSSNGSDSSATIESLLSAEPADTSRINSIFAQSILEKVIHSWELIANNKEAVGIDFFTRVFVEHPELLQRFPFGAELVGRPQDTRHCEGLKKHAINVMNFIGHGVRGLSDIESLIPDLRAIGKTHVKAGVSSAHYDMFYRNLMNAFAAELCNKWNQDIADAWGNIYTGMTTVMDAPEQLNQTEALAGWGLALASASAFIAFVTPFRLAGFSVPFSPFVSLMMDLLEVVAALVLAGDMISSRIVRLLKFEKPTKASRDNANCFLQRSMGSMLTPLKFRLFHEIFSLHLERWVPWPRLDGAILLSYALQILNRWNRLTTLYATQVGVSWTHAIGLVRVFAALRVFYFARCAENSAILKQSKTDEWRRAALISHLLFTLIYVMHVSASLWSLVARIELGSSATEQVASEFFPDTSILLGKAGIAKSYLISIYWAWVNLAGTGNIDSAPSQPLEILAILMVHMWGATLFAIATGHVVNILEQLTHKENQVGNDLAELRSFMDECEMTTAAQERIMHGYIAQNIMRSEGDLSIPDLKDDVGRKLPPHFRVDLELHARAVALQRRNHIFEACSSKFLFSLAHGMRQTRKLLPGDFLFQAGEMVPRRFRMIEKGTLEIVHGDESIGTLQRGSAIGFGWLVDATLPAEARLSFPKPFELSDWLLANGTAGVSIRATSECIVASGLPSPLEIEVLQRRFPNDFEILEHQRTAASERIARTREFRGVIRTAINLNKKTT